MPLSRIRALGVKPATKARAANASPHEAYADQPELRFAFMFHRLPVILGWGGGNARTQKREGESSRIHCVSFLTTGFGFFNAQSATRMNSEDMPTEMTPRI
ncbi:MAG: hypothetical protein M2R45_03022 [Verrucomicrobia subdivision 3 bacterium]|nr:hypothetical protein [Limisphaerales bacterium]MCS1415542.1 hypothetical protein [Limisphaerales bacterium]